MDKTLYIREITEGITLLDIKKLKEVLHFINFLKYEEYIDPTLEIISNEEWYKKKFGIDEMKIKK